MIASLLLVALPFAAAAPWAQPADSDVYKLFPKRQASKFRSHMLNSPC